MDRTMRDSHYSPHVQWSTVRQQTFQDVMYVRWGEIPNATTRNPQPNGLAKPYIKTIVAQLCHLVSEHQRDWYLFVQQLNYCYNIQAHHTAE